MTRSRQAPATASRGLAEGLLNAAYQPRF